MLRAAAATVEIVGFSACAHAAADGAVPTADELLWVGLGVFAASALLLTGRLRVRTVFAMCTALQVGLHLAYASFGSSAMPSMSQMAPMPGMHAMPSSQMVIAHVLSAVVTGLVLLVQDRAVRRIAGLAAIAPLAAPTLRGPLTSLRAETVGAGIELLHVSPTRGPPFVPSPTTS